MSDITLAGALVAYLAFVWLVAVTVGHAASRYNPPTRPPSEHDRREDSISFR